MKAFFIQTDMKMEVHLDLGEELRYVLF